MYKAVENHSMGLEPGDQVLGYEGRSWKDLYKELLSYELPLTAMYFGSNKQNTEHILLTSAGENWHLFDTLDKPVTFDVAVFSRNRLYWTSSFGFRAKHPSFVKNENDQLPEKFALFQNYFNPFNPSTTIEFTLSKSEYVELKVYNILGKEVATLVSKKLNQGNHTYIFDGSNLASGIYYYQLTAGEYREVKKMVLIR